MILLYLYKKFCPRGHPEIPPPPGWTSVDFLLTPPTPLLVHVVVECPLSSIFKNALLFKWCPIFDDTAISTFLDIKNNLILCRLTRPNRHLGFCALPGKFFWVFHKLRTLKKSDRNGNTKVLLFKMSKEKQIWFY